MSKRISRIISIMLVLCFMVGMFNCVTVRADLTRVAVNELKLYTEDEIKDPVMGEELFFPEIKISNMSPEGLEDYIYCGCQWYDGRGNSYGVNDGAGVKFYPGDWTLKVFIRCRTGYDEGYSLCFKDTYVNSPSGLAAITLDGKEFKLNDTYEYYDYDDGEYYYDLYEALEYTREYHVYDVGIAPAFEDTALREGRENELYASELKFLYGSPAINCKVVDGELPEGLYISGHSIAGMPTKCGTYTFTIRAENAYGSDEKEFTLYVNANDYTIHSLRLDYVGHPYAEFEAPKLGNSICCFLSGSNLRYDTSNRLEIENFWYHVEENKCYENRSGIYTEGTWIYSICVVPTDSRYSFDLNSIMSDDSNLKINLAGFEFVLNKESSTKNRIEYTSTFVFKNETKVDKPKGTKIEKVKSKKKALKIYWKKQSSGKGYQIQLSTNKTFGKNVKNVWINKSNKNVINVKKLKKKKKYYIRIRTYKLSDGKRTYSSWSKTVAKKTK